LMMHDDEVFSCVIDDVCIIVHHQQGPSLPKNFGSRGLVSCPASPFWK
jgi:hypothetical protein